MRFDILTIFPEIFSSYINESILKIAQEKGLIEIHIHNIRDFSKDKHKKVDDTPFGGGAGMLMTAQPLYDAIKYVKTLNKGEVIYFTPQGKTLTQSKVEKFAKIALQDEKKGESNSEDNHIIYKNESILFESKVKISVSIENRNTSNILNKTVETFISAENKNMNEGDISEENRNEGNINEANVNEDNINGNKGINEGNMNKDNINEGISNGIILLCGRYEGIDQRIRDLLVDEEISIGDYVLTGGELAAMIFVDSVSRLIPGVLGSEESHMEDSFSKKFKRKKEYPQYTRPAEFKGLKVPDVLISGHHANIEKWKEDNLK